jgi:hypothetical protein
MSTVQIKVLGDLEDDYSNADEKIESLKSWLGAVESLIRHPELREAQDSETYRVVASAFKHNQRIDFLDTVRRTNATIISCYYVTSVRIEVTIELQFEEKAVGKAKTFKFSYGLETNGIINTERKTKTIR